MSAASRQRRLKAERQKRWIRNQRRGVSIISVPVDHDTTEALVGLGWVLECESEDPRHVGTGISELLADAAKHWHRRNT